MFGNSVIALGIVLALIIPLYLGVFIWIATMIEVGIE